MNKSRSPKPRQHVQAPKPRPRFLQIAAIVGVAVVCLALWIVPTLLLRVSPEDSGAPTLMDPALPADASSFLRALHVAPPFARRALPVVAVMVENHRDARPYQDGLEDALLIAEFPVEGGITRFAAFFDANALPDRVGPIRSLRPYFIDFIEPWAGLVLRAGGSPEAEDRAASVDTLTDVNALRGEFMDFTVRDNDIPAPHNLFATREQIEQLVDEHPVPLVRWPPYAVGVPPMTGTSATVVELNFFSRDHNVTYTYDAARRLYTRVNGDVASDAHPRNIIIAELPIVDVGEHGRLTIPTTGEGLALVFRDGHMQRGTWHNDVRGQTMSIERDDGTPVLLAPGMTWFTALPNLDRVSWEE